MAMGMAQPHVSRAYRELLAAEIIVKRGKEYQMSPLVGWKGKENELEIALRELWAETQKAERKAKKTLTVVS